MGKVILLFIFVFTELFCVTDNVKQLQQKCLSCHQAQQIPDELIYRRYLMVYSTSEGMQKAIFRYIKYPDKKNSVMHHPFFFKFPMKGKLDLGDVLLQRLIKEYLFTFDIKHKFISPNID